MNTTDLTPENPEPPMTNASLPPRPYRRLRRVAAGLTIAAALPLTVAVSCDTGQDQENQQEQEEQDEEEEDD